jgi:glycosyltransferase involved in cell wall biosynthesis
MYGPGAVEAREPWSERSNRMRLLALVPAYNEEGNILKLIDGIRTELPEADILIVNDCSTDETARILDSKPGIIWLDLPFNMGIGGAVLSGFAYFLEHGYDTVVRMDGDGQHPPSEAVKLVEALSGEGVDAVIGSRYLASGAEYSSKTRMMGIKLLDGLSSLILGKRYTDNTSGFRAFNREAVEYLVRDYPSDYPEPEEIYYLTRGGFNVVEVHVEMRSREAGVSSIGSLNTLYYLVKVLLTIFVKYMIGGKK